MNQRLKEKIRESLSSVLPITAIVLLLSFTLAPVPMGTLGLFFLGAVMLIVGMGLFTLGADMSLMQMGNHIGAHLTRSRNLKLMVGVMFIMGVFITMAEPDLTVLANQVPGIPNPLLIGAVAFGVGLFLVAAVLRVVFQKKLSYMLIALYAVVFFVAIFVSEDYVPVAFDSGGVASGAMTATFLLPFAMGACSALGGNMLTDAFGVVAMVAMTPLITIQALGLIYRFKTRHMEAMPADAASASDDEIIDVE